jgi:hypothetical protein
MMTEKAGPGQWVEALHYCGGTWVREDEWWTIRQLLAFADQESRSWESFRWALRKRTYRRTATAAFLLLAAAGFRAAFTKLLRRSVRRP